MSKICYVSLLLGLVSFSNAQAQQFLLQATFKKIDHIYTGEVANITALDQSVRLGLFPTKLVNVETGEDLLTSPDATLTIRDTALRSEQSPTHATKYCLDMVRSLAVNPTSDAEMSLFVYVTHIGATNFVVHKFNSCTLQLP